MVEILKEFSEKNLKEDVYSMVNVRRSAIWEDSSRHMERKRFGAILSVRFAGEEGIDAGGPCREYFRLVMKALSESPIFEGPQTSRVLLVNSAGL